ncbi:MAG: ParB/RepB/Spo0J family partition protein [Clostridiales bacterium]|nr:ParB/RepB/Spo0J family partition protein [Clostridiales bacterium]
MVKKKGLGRGLESLFGDNNLIDESFSKNSDSSVVSRDLQPQNIVSKDTQEIALSSIFPNVDQPRKIFDANSLDELANSIKIHGVVSPLIVVKSGKKYMLVAGERRFRASKLAGLKTVPVIIKDYDNKQIKEISLIDNIQREDLNAIDLASYLHQLMEEFGYTQDQLADRVGKSRSHVTNLLRLLQLNVHVKDYVINNKLSAGHARCLIVIDDASAQIGLANKCIENSCSVRELENLVKNFLANKNSMSVKTKTKRSSSLDVLQERLQSLFDTKVSISGSEKKGRICIDYSNKVDLERFQVLIGLLESL